MREIKREIEIKKERETERQTEKERDRETETETTTNRRDSVLLISFPPVSFLSSVDFVCGSQLIKAATTTNSMQEQQQHQRHNSSVHVNRLEATTRHPGFTGGLFSPILIAHLPASAAKMRRRRTETFLRNRIS